jgi:hypothetical protein
MWREVSSMMLRTAFKRVRESPRLKFALAGELPRRSVSHLRQARTVRAQQSLIPSIVHQTWIDNRFGRTHATYLEGFRSLNPDFSFHIWVDDERHQFVFDNYFNHPIRTIYEKALFGPLSTDIWRYLVLLKVGGWYFDIKSCVTAPLFSLLNDAQRDKAVITFERNLLPGHTRHIDAGLLAHPHNVVANWGLASAPGFGLIEELVDNICVAYPEFKGKPFSRPKPAILDFTGPHRMTQVVRSFSASAEFKDVVQAGIDFNGTGVYEIPGSRVRYLSIPHYAKVRDTPIVK